MNQELQPLFEVDAIKVAVGGTPDPEVAAPASRYLHQSLGRTKGLHIGCIAACVTPQNTKPIAALQAL